MSQSCQISITFKPVAVSATNSGQLLVSSDAVVPTYSLALSGRGLPEPSIMHLDEESGSIVNENSWNTLANTGPVGVTTAAYVDGTRGLEFFNDATACYLTTPPDARNALSDTAWTMEA